MFFFILFMIVLNNNIEIIIFFIKKNFFFKFSIDNIYYFFFHFYCIKEYECLCKGLYYKMLIKYNYNNKKKWPVCFVFCSLFMNKELVNVTLRNTKRSTKCKKEKNKKKTFYTLII